MLVKNKESALIWEAMTLQTKALYYLLRLNWEKDPSISHLDWQVENLRLISEEELFARLQNAGYSIDKEAFFSFAQECDTPEDLAELLIAEKMDSEEGDALYLVLFELWRRLLPEKQSLSLFGDELDHLISQYRKEEMETDELIQDVLARMKQLFEESVDLGASAQEAFERLETYCAHNLDQFLIEYILEQLYGGNPIYASELIEQFQPHAKTPLWFEFFQVFLLEVPDAKEAIEDLLKKRKPLPFDLLLELIYLISEIGGHHLMVKIVKRALRQGISPEEGELLVYALIDYYERSDGEETEPQIAEFQKWLFVEDSLPLISKWVEKEPS